jgi:hypothetical protein
VQRSNILLGLHKLTMSSGSLETISVWIRLELVSFLQLLQMNMLTVCPVNAATLHMHTKRLSAYDGDSFNEHEPYKLEGTFMALLAELELAGIYLEGLPPYVIHLFIKEPQLDKNTIHVPPFYFSMDQASDQGSTEAVVNALGLQPTFEVVHTFACWEHHHYTALCQLYDAHGFDPNSSQVGYALGCPPILLFEQSLHHDSGESSDRNCGVTVLMC